MKARDVFPHSVVAIFNAVSVGADPFHIYVPILRHRQFGLNSEMGNIKGEDGGDVDTWAFVEMKPHSIRIGDEMAYQATL